MIRIHLKGDELQALEIAVAALRKWAADGNLPVPVLKYVTVLPARHENMFYSIFDVVGKFECRSIIVDFDFRLGWNLDDNISVRSMLFNFENKDVYKAERPDLRSRDEKGSRSSPEQALRIFKRMTLVIRR
jgi:hypothetical protein